MKKATRTILALLLALLTMSALLVPASAQTSNFRMIYTPFSLDDEHIEYYVSGYKGTAPATVTIPATYKGEKVTYVSNDAFNGCQTIRTLNIPDGIYLGYSSFAGCTNLQAVHGGKVDLEGFTFYNCVNLSVLDCEINCVYDKALGNCKSLKKVRVTGFSVYEEGFDGCTNLKTIEVTACFKPDELEELRKESDFFKGVELDYIRLKKDFDIEKKKMNVWAGQEYTYDLKAAYSDKDVVAQCADVIWERYADNYADIETENGILKVTTWSRGKAVLRGSMVDKNGVVIGAVNLTLHACLTPADAVERAWDVSLLGRVVNTIIYR